MIRHSLNLFLRQKANVQPNEDKKKKIVEALQFLNHRDFHKRLRNGCNLQQLCMIVFLLLVPHCIIYGMSFTQKS